MQPEYTTVIDPATILPTAIAMLIHVAVAGLQVLLAGLMIASGASALLRPHARSAWLQRLGVASPDGAGRRALAGLRVVFGLMLILPVVGGAPSLTSLLAGVGIFGLLLFGQRAIPAVTRVPGRLALLTTAAVTIFMVWEGEDGLALGAALTTNMRDWRDQEIEWQLRNDVDAPKVGDPAPDFSLQDPSGAKTVRLSDFRGKRPVVLVFGSYT